MVEAGEVKEGEGTAVTESLGQDSELCVPHFACLAEGEDFGKEGLVALFEGIGWEEKDVEEMGSDQDD